MLAALYPCCKMAPRLSVGRYYYYFIRSELRDDLGSHPLAALPPAAPRSPRMRIRPSVATRVRLAIRLQVVKLVRLFG